MYIIYFTRILYLACVAHQFQELPQGGGGSSLSVAPLEVQQMFEALPHCFRISHFFLLLKHFRVLFFFPGDLFPPSPPHTLKVHQAGIHWCGF